MCTCMTNINADLKEHNTRLATSFVITRDRKGMDCLPIVQTEKLQTKSRTKPIIVIPTYCPFCGVRYQRAGEEGDSALASMESADLATELPATEGHGK